MWIPNGDICRRCLRSNDTAILIQIKDLKDDHSRVIALMKVYLKNVENLCTMLCDYSDLSESIDYYKVRLMMYALKMN
jgi:hypothetical protein